LVKPPWDGTFCRESHKNLGVEPFGAFVTHLVYFLYDYWVFEGCKFQTWLKIGVIYLVAAFIIDI